jgi:hypothetical protein
MTVEDTSLGRIEDHEFDMDPESDHDSGRHFPGQNRGS